jgi:SprT protein
VSTGSHAEALRGIAEERLKQLCEEFPLGYVPQLVWKGYRVTAGLAYYRTGVIGLSTRVLKDEQAVVDTLIHEYAHLLAVVRHGQRAAGHGPAWQRAMMDLGQEPRVRHSYEVERNIARQSVTYVCLRCGRSVVRHRRLPRRRRYVHANCGGDLRLSKVDRITAELKDA